MFPAGVALPEEIVAAGPAGLRKELYSLLTFEAIEERARLGAMWRRLCVRDSRPREPEPRPAHTLGLSTHLEALATQAHAFQDAPSRLSTEKRADLAAFVKALARLLDDSGFQRVSQRDFTIGCALEDHQGVMRVEVSVDETNLVNMGRLLDGPALRDGDKDLGAVLIWKRGHGIQVERGFLFLRKLDYLQSKLLVSLIRVSKRIAWQAWTSSESWRQHVLDQLTSLEGQRFGKSLIQAGRGTATLTVEAIYNLLVRWGAISKRKISLNEFLADGSWPPEGPGVAVEQAAVGEAMTMAMLQARESILRHHEYVEQERILFQRLISPIMGEDFTNDDRFLVYLPQPSGTDRERDRDPHNTGPLSPLWTAMGLKQRGELQLAALRQRGRVPAVDTKRLLEQEDSKDRERTHEVRADKAPLAMPARVITPARVTPKYRLTSLLPSHPSSSYSTTTAATASAAREHDEGTHGGAAVATPASAASQLPAPTSRFPTSHACGGWGRFVTWAERERGRERAVSAAAAFLEVYIHPN